MFRSALVIVSVALFAAACGTPPAAAPVEGAEGPMTTSAGVSVAESSPVLDTGGEETSPETVDPEDAEQQVLPASTSDEYRSYADDSYGDVEEYVEPLESEDSSYVEPSGSEESSSGDEPTVAEEPAHSGLVAIAIADLADRLGIDESAITLVSFESVVWPDGSLGCPQPGMAYIQVLVDGSLIVLSVEGREFRYHSGGSGDPFLCLNPVLDGFVSR